ncbi:MAG: PIG-L deacetylase family protein [bacterium]
MKKVLAFGCHPDDIEFMAAGTLALLAERGYEVHLATMTGGEVGSPTLSREAIKAKRLGEAAAAAKVLNGKYHYAGGCDLEVEYNAFYRRAATKIMREVDPEIVFTLPPTDYMADHELTSRLVRNAAYIAPVPLYDCGTAAPPTARAPHLYYWNAIGLKDIFGRPLPMSLGVDITSVVGMKEKMLACHESQREWLAALGWDSYLKVMQNWSREQGCLIGCEFGECFIQHRGAGFPQDNRLVEVLGDLCFTCKA